MSIKFVVACLFATIALGATPTPEVKPANTVRKDLINALTTLEFASRLQEMNTGGFGGNFGSTTSRGGGFGSTGRATAGKFGSTTRGGFVAPEPMIPFGFGGFGNPSVQPMQPMSGFGGFGDPSVQPMSGFGGGFGGFLGLGGSTNSLLPLLFLNKGAENDEDDKDLLNCILFTGGTGNSVLPCLFLNKDKDDEDDKDLLGLSLLSGLGGTKNGLLSYLLL